jgi:hypothetical protein
LRYKTKIKVSQLKKIISEIVQENDPGTYMRDGTFLWSRLTNDIIDMVQDEYEAAVEGITDEMKKVGDPPPSPYKYYEDAAEELAVDHAQAKLKALFREVVEHFNYKL